MKNVKQSFVFFGSGSVAAESLRLLQPYFTFEAVVTKPTTLQEMRSVAGTTQVYAVSDKQALDDLFTTKNFKSTLGILIDFGIIVSKKIIDYFPHGIVNSHFSLLPELRGADPISFAILEGKKQTGVSLMLLVEAMDEGPLLSQTACDIEPADTTQTLTDKLIRISADSLVEHLPDYLSNKLVAQDQAQFNSDGASPSYTRKLTKADGRLEWQQPAEVLERQIRAFITWPKSFTTLSGIECVITEAGVIDKQGDPGSLFVHEKQLAIHCGRDALLIHRIKPAGKPEMDSRAFLAGYKSRLELL